MRGPFDTAQAGTVDAEMLADARAFDPNAASSTGDLWRRRSGRTTR